MRVAFSGDTSVERDLLEDRATEAGLHVATSLSRLTSLLVTNDPDSGTSKVVKARQFGRRWWTRRPSASCWQMSSPRTPRREPGLGRIAAEPYGRVIPGDSPGARSPASR